ncbi:hypothetical protein JI58_03140 [Marinosulfonomonas sp. PRT-SC04]|nr:hypothetical protein JI58_03140 [Marinosulfonomonas sp. PRT-SC04]
MADTKDDAGKAFDLFCAKYQVKYEKAVACLKKDRDALLTFFDFPAEHWKHIRTTNPIESTFATVRHRTKRTKGCLKRNTAMVMVFKLIKEAEKRWLKLRGKNQLPKLIQGVTFSDGIEIIEKQTKSAA